MNKHEAIRAKLNTLHHTSYEMSETGRYHQEVNEIIATILKDQLEGEYEHHARNCRDCQEMQRMMDEWEI